MKIKTIPLQQWLTDTERLLKIKEGYRYSVHGKPKDTYCLCCGNKLHAICHSLECDQIFKYFNKESL